MNKYNEFESHTKFRRNRSLGPLVPRKKIIFSVNTINGHGSHLNNVARIMKTCILYGKPLRSLKTVFCVVHTPILKL